MGAAAKNVIGIAAGMLDGIDLTSLKGALMSRGTREVSRPIKAMMDLGKKYGVDLPISRAVYEILYYHKEPRYMLNELFARTIKKVF